MSTRTIKDRLAALAAKMPADKRRPRLCIVTDDEPAHVRKAKLAEAERLGDPILEVTLYDAEAVAS